MKSSRNYNKIGLPVKAINPVCEKSVKSWFRSYGSLERILERALVIHRHVDPAQGLTLGHSGEDFLRDLGKQAPRQNVIDVPRAALDFA